METLGGKSSSIVNTGFELQILSLAIFNQESLVHILLSHGRGPLLPQAYEVYFYLQIQLSLGSHNMCQLPGLELSCPYSQLLQR